CLLSPSTRRAPHERRRAVATACGLVVGLRVFGEPGLRDALLRARQPRFGDQVQQLFAVDPREARYPDEHRGIAVEVRRREEDTARVREQQLLYAEIRDAEHEHVVEALLRLRVNRVLAAAAMAAEELAVDEVRRT